MEMEIAKWLLIGFVTSVVNTAIILAVIHKRTGRQILIHTS